ncbi:hypothetical protein [Actinokineospora globicatena]|uniref:hypothetical protein n=1 Tax=Actinokineospora globicatena TaxID=103729 RepID=UPI0020A566A0|nr:hypothetical protein [Actinokineospora globicatena]
MDIDDELRRLFADERLDVPVRPGATDAVVTGAGRRRKRRIAVTAAGGALTLAVLVAGGVAFSGLARTSSSPPGQEGMPTLSTTVSTTTAQVPTSAVVPGAGSASDAAGTATKPTSAGKLTTSVSRAPTVPELRPAGFGKVRIGMSVAEAEATGELVAVDLGSAECRAYTFKAYPDRDSLGVGISPVDGVVAIFPPKGARTPEGIGIGSTEAELLTAYPAATTNLHGYRIVKLDGGKVYSFGFGQGKSVVEFSLYTDKQMCFG